MREDAGFEEEQPATCHCKRCHGRPCMSASAPDVHLRCCRCCAHAVMGGAYLTLLNTIANMGIILPKIGLYAAMDWLTVSSCRAGGAGGAAVAGLTCPKKIRELAGSNECTNAGHTCQLDMDGFYSVSFAMACVGLLLGLAFARLFPYLTRLPLQRWRAKHSSLKAA
eukprot:GHRQ01023158.1.p1 GENE.GHRQ01023158.1~~GHRQ01023158.1.p1  ORF type:complete len:167 (+),score=56.78 GHRQ01023158.1:344-844(+)